MANLDEIRKAKTPEEMEALGYKIYPPVLPSFGAMISQEHSEEVVKLLTEYAVDFHVSIIGCSPTTMAIYAKFESVEKQKDFETALTPYPITPWS